MRRRRRRRRAAARFRTGDRVPSSHRRRRTLHAFEDGPALDVVDTEAGDFSYEDGSGFGVADSTNVRQIAELLANPFPRSAMGESFEHR
ncbi:hypothetical protein AGR2A_Cc130016 [Agrobacterium genomosp. 2 str. CFBP 5494]|uniref:Uncharacterized protein n=1 Tax=Agrobacterium genomosp. 2 str. CFBP 5494 TaxID=1183436 RepID=A0A9W5AYW5_9HYPH|nr:hypothetical protein AGR2A_Cc130016 [Agrobacterium genomosp. 2 str. CFBP 5494]